MALVTVNGGVIGDTYQGGLQVPVLHIFLSADMTTAESVSLLRSDPEQGQFYKLVPCTINADLKVVYPSFTLHSTTDALINPDRAKYVMTLYTLGGLYIQNVAARIQVPPTPNPTSLSALEAFSALYNPVSAPGEYSNEYIDELFENLALGDLSDVDLATSAPVDGNALVWNNTPGKWVPGDVSASVNAAIAALIDSAPSALDTLNELAAALGDDPNFATSIATVLSLKAEGPLVSVDENIPIFDGVTGRVLKDSGINISEIGGGGAAELDDLTDVDLATNPPTDGDALVYDSGTSLWVPGEVSGGGGGTVPTFAELPPTSPSVYDDEFNAGTLDAKWTQSSTGTAPTVAINQYPADSCYRAQFGSANGMVSILQSFVPGANPFSITFKVSARGSANYQGWQFFVRNATDGGIRIASYFSAGGILIHSYPSFTALNSPTGPLPNEAVWNYVHVERNAADAWKTYWSRDGISWGRLDGGITQALTVTRVELLFDQSGAAEPFWAACDWIRFNAMFL